MRLERKIKRIKSREKKELFRQDGADPEREEWDVTEAGGHQGAL